MAKDKENNASATFAWLIYREVEKYISEHPEEFQSSLQDENEEGVREHEH
jgi:hypothetical protein